jgi:hypothetical protein
MAQQLGSSCQAQWNMSRASCLLPHLLVVPNALLALVCSLEEGAAYEGYYYKLQGGLVKICTRPAEGPAGAGKVPRHPRSGAAASWLSR